MERPDDRSDVTARVRKINWRRVISELDALPPETQAFIGVLDQSVRTHIKKGRYKYIDPDRYDVWTYAVPGSRTQARLYMQRRR
jgi:hypothetical protein